MKIAVAPNAFKGTLSPVQAASAIREGVLRACPRWEVVTVPMADGGDGTVEAVAAATGRSVRSERVSDPLGRPVRTSWLPPSGGEPAVVEMARASGLALLDSKEWDPLRTDSRGTGELIRAALDAGARRVVVGLGGTATVDGAMGAARALGVRFLDGSGIPLPPGGGALGALATIEGEHRDPRLAEVEIVAACDVSNPLLGPRGAARTYASQKGASPEEVEVLERGLENLARVAERCLKTAPVAEAGAGAAGGAGFGLRAFLGARLHSGVACVGRMARLEQALDTCQLVITGEGRVDASTRHGKVPVGVARLARRRGLPVLVIGGTVAAEARGLEQEGIEACFAVSERPPGSVPDPERARSDLVRCAERVARFIRRSRRPPR